MKKESDKKNQSTTQVRGVALHDKMVQSEEEGAAFRSQHNGADSRKEDIRKSSRKP